MFLWVGTQRGQSRPPSASSCVSARERYNTIRMATFDSAVPGWAGLLGIVGVPLLPPSPSQNTRPRTRDANPPITALYSSQLANQGAAFCAVCVHVRRATIVLSFVGRSHICLLLDQEDGK